MKLRMILPLILLMTATTFLSAQQKLKFPTDESRVAFAKKNIIVGLRSGNVGVVASTLMLAAKLKMSFPGTKVSEIEAIIDSLSVSGSSAVIRYKAYLVAHICGDPEWFAAEQSLHTPEQEIFYTGTARRLQDKMLGVRSL